jgi:hypothetical protein
LFSFLYSIHLYIFLFQVSCLLLFSGNIFLRFLDLEESNISYVLTLCWTIEVFCNEYSMKIILVFIMVQLFFLTLENNKSDIGELRGLFTSLKKGQLITWKKSECLDHLAKMGSVMKPSANLNCGLCYVWQNHKLAK